VLKRRSQSRQEREMQLLERLTSPRKNRRRKSFQNIGVDRGTENAITEGLEASQSSLRCMDSEGREKSAIRGMNHQWGVYPNREQSTVREGEKNLAKAFAGGSYKFRPCYGQGQERIGGSRQKQELTSPGSANDESTRRAKGSGPICQE